MTPNLCNSERSIKRANGFKSAPRLSLADEQYQLYKSFVFVFKNFCKRFTFLINESVKSIDFFFFQVIDFEVLNLLSNYNSDPG